MSNNNNTLNSLLIGGLRGSFKSWFIFLVLGALVFGAATASADPNINYYTVNANNPSLLLETYIDAEKTQFGISVDNYNSVDLKIYRVEFLVTNDQNETYTSNYRSSDAEVVKTEVFSINAPEFFREIPFEAGTYQFVVTSAVNTGLTFGQAGYNGGAVILSAILFVISGLAIGIFFSILPFAIFVVLVNAVFGNKSQSTPSPRPQTRYQTTREPTARRSRSSWPKEGFFSRFSEKDWAGVAIATVFFFLSFAVPNGPFFFFFVILTVGTLYNVTEREKMIDRILVLLEHYPETNVEFLSRQLGEKSKKKVINVLQVMILDDGVPIRLNLNNNTVRLVGPIPGYYRSSPVYSSQRVQSQTSPQSTEPVVTQQVKQPVQEPVVVQVSQSSPVVEEQASKPTKTDNFCTGCGEDLIAEVKYCYACGQKN